MDGDGEPQSECPGCRRLSAELEQLRREVELLRQALEESRRAGKRQAAPFRKQKVPAPQKPGRKPGDEYGQQSRRSIPEQIDEHYDVPLPEYCPHCGCHELTTDRVCPQYQTDIPRKPIHRQFNIHIGRCSGCGERVQGRHELQTSDALGAAASQLGADLQAALTVANQELGLSHGKCRRLIERLFGISISRSTNCRTQQRLAERLRPSYDAIGAQVRGSPRVVCDETGWRVNGENAWLHDFVTERATYYAIDPTRSAEPALLLLGEDYSGTLIHDGWSVYDRFTLATHQQCLAHLMRRCHELLETAVAGAVWFPRAALDVFRAALAARDRFRQNELTAHGLRVLAGRFTSTMRRLVAPVKRNAASERLAKHLENHLDDLFTFLRDPLVDATNWRAEQAIRPAVVNRKVWGGNRTWNGAETQAILTTVLVTAAQQTIDPLDFLKQNLTSPRHASY
ncbi:IS66 family transposase, partial [bacterium]|nr:IS66 family transposase [bacterium]